MWFSKQSPRVCSLCGNWDIEPCELPWRYQVLSFWIPFRAKKCRKCFHVDVYQKKQKQK